MQHEIDIGHGLRPAFVAHEVGGDEAQPVAVHHARLRERRPHLGLPGERSNGGPHAMILREELEDAVSGDEA